MALELASRFCVPTMACRPFPAAEDRSPLYHDRLPSAVRGSVALLDMLAAPTTAARPIRQPDERPDADRQHGRDPTYGRLS